jgi:hypothetical protein
MKRLCLFFALASTQAHAADDWIGGFVLADQQRIGLNNGFNSTPLNNDNFLRIAPNTSTLVGLVEGSYKDTSFRTRVEANTSNLPEQGTRSSITLQELNQVFRINDASTLSLGKRLYSLDPSYVNQPLGFFQKSTDLTDPLDALGKSEGVPMAVLSWNGAKAGITALYSKDIGNQFDGRNKGVEQSLIKLSYEFDQLSTSVLLRRASGESAGIGATFSGNSGDSLSYYGSFYSAKGSQRPILNTLLGQSSIPELGFYRSNDGIRYNRATLGLIYTPQDLAKWQIEYSYDGRGLSDAQYAGFLDQMKRNQATQLPDIAIKVQQAMLAQMLTSQGMRRRYLSLSLTQSMGAWEWGAGVYAGLDDHSRTWHGTAEYKYTPRISLLLSAIWQDGANNSERTLSPITNSVAARLRWLY